ncbi:MAG: hypothetical protein RL331_93 [Bacteroidota bacterium]
MLRSLFSLLLVALFISKLVYGLIWQVHYELNKAEITARYCENKNRPELHCNGQCYLAKQLQKADSALQAKEQEQQQHLDLGAKIISEEYFLSNASIHLKIYPISEEQQVKTSFSSPFYSFLYVQNCFHPPCMA